MRAFSPRNPRGLSNNRDSDSSSRARFNSAGARYDVLDRVGEGTLFVTYRVRVKNTDRVLALKALKSVFSKHQQFAPVLTQGASKSLELEHPHVAQLFEIGEEEGTTFLVTEWLSGQSLEARLRRAPFGRIEALTSTRQIAAGLQYLHHKGITHGDLRPRQVLGSGDGLLKLTDAGTSSAFSAAGLSIADVQQDSIYYLAPERTVANNYGDAPATISSDLYALGAILYRMLSGRVPFAGPSPVAVAMRHRHDEPLPPSRFNPQCPPDLEAIAMRLLAKEPSQRFASAQEVIEALLPPQQSTLTVPASSENFTEAEDASTRLDADALTVEETLQTTTLNESQSVVGPSAAPPAPDTTAATAAATSTQDISATPDLFPADLSLTALAATPLAQLSAPAATSAAATSFAARSAAATNATDDATNVAMNTNKTPSAKATTSPAVVPPSASNTASTSTRSAASPGVDDEKKARKKQRRRELLGATLALAWVFIGIAILIGIFYGSYELWVRSAPKDVKVPSYIGLSEPRAKQALSRAGLALTVRGEVFNPKQAAGTIISGDPRPGRMVKAGRTVAVTISRGAEQIAMPDLSDLDLQRARQILSRAGMKLGNVTEIYHDKVARGYVAGQFPLPGEAFSRSEPINLVISRGPQPSNNTQASPDLLPPPPPPSTGTSTEDDPLSAPPEVTGSMQDGKTPLVSRTVLVRVPVPAKNGATSRSVKIVVRDASGDHTIYNEPHAPGELIDEYVRVTRPQGSTATISIYIDGELQKQQKV